MDNFMEAIQGIPVEPLVLVAMSGTVLAIGSLAYGWWQERKYRKMGETVVDAIKRSVEDRIRKGNLFFSYQEIRHLMGQILGAELQELEKTGKINQQVADFLREQLARKMGVWELFPKHAKSCERPDPVQVKTTIRERLNGSVRVIPFPDLTLFPKTIPSLGEELSTILGRR